MAKTTHKLKISDLDKMIMKEIQAIKDNSAKKAKLRARLLKINEDLARLQGQNEPVKEVHVSGTQSGSEYYEKDTPVASFKKKGSHLIEDDLETSGLSAGETVTGMADEEPMMTIPKMADGSFETDSKNLPPQLGPITGDEPAIGEETFENKLAAIGRELDAKLSGGAVADMEMDSVADDMGTDSIEDTESEEEPLEIELGDDESEEESSEEEESSDEEEKEKEEDPKSEAKEEESKEEVKEEAKPSLNESKTFDFDKNPKLLSEMERMRRLAKLL